MKNTALSPLASGEQDLLHQFFEAYPSATIEQKLWSCYGTKSFMAPPDEDTTAELRFYEHLMYVLRELQRCGPNGTRAAPAIGQRNSLSLLGIVDLIKHAIPVGMIFRVDAPDERLDLMVVLEKSCNSRYSEFEQVIELAMLGYPDGTCTVHNFGLLNAQLSNGHVFYTQVCTDANLIYRKNAQEVFKLPSRETIARAREDAFLAFNAGMQRVMRFYQGVQFYLKDSILEMAMFMLHQAAELTYRCLLNVLRGKDLKSHSLAVLRKHVRRFAPRVIGVFSEVEEEELYYLQLLEDAYTQARYEMSYSIDYGTVIFLNERVGRFLECAGLGL